MIAAGRASGAGGVMVLGAVGVSEKGKGAGGLELKPSSSSWMPGLIVSVGLANGGVDVDAGTVLTVVAWEIIGTWGELEVLGSGRFIG